jgi:hypothetical protein
MTDLLIDPEVAISSENAQVPAQPVESDGNILDDTGEPTDQPELEPPVAENIKDTFNEAEPPGQQDEQTIDHWMDTKSSIAAVSEANRPVEENDVDNSTDCSEALQKETSSANKQSQDSTQTMELRYTPQGDTDHRTIRAIINQTITDLQEAGGVATVKQETTITTVTELTTVPLSVIRNGDDRNNNETSRTEIVITLLTPADIPEEIILPLLERAAKEKSIELQT